MRLVIVEGEKPGPAEITPAPFTSLKGGVDFAPGIAIAKETPDQLARKLWGEIALPTTPENQLPDDQTRLYLQLYGFMLVRGLTHPNESQIGPSDLSPFLRERLGRMESDLSPTYATDVAADMRGLLPAVKRGQAFTARRVAFVTNDALNELGKTDDFVREAILVFGGNKDPQDFDPYLRPPSKSVEWAFNAFRARTSTN